jgi:hypothetical protein
MRKAKRAKERPPAPGQRPFLWIITPTLSKAVQNGFGAVQDVDWPAGVLFAPKDWHTGFIVVHKLPKTPETLWFRLFSKGNFQAQAFSELAQLPLEHPYRNPLMNSLANLKVILEERSSRTLEEQDLFMQLSPLYLEKIAAAEQVGEKRGEQRGRREVVLLLLAQKFDSLPTDLKTRIEALSMEQLQSLTTSLFQFVAIDDLSNWLDGVASPLENRL